MKIILKGFVRRTNELLGLDYMDGKFKVLAANYLFIMMYYTLETVFVNTLLYRITPDMSIVIHYRAVVFFSIAVASNTGAFLSKRFSPVTVIKLGGFAYIVMYLILFFGMDRMDILKDIVAVFSGIGAGFYWSGHNVLLTHYTNKRNRGIGVSILGLIQGIMTLLVPVISGFVISLMPGNTGYRVMFGIGMLTVLLQKGLQNKLSPVEGEIHKSRLRLALKFLWRKTTCQIMLCYEFIRGIRDGVFIFFLNMVLFQIVTEESLVGINTFLTGVMAILGSWAYGKLAGPGRRVKLALLATTILFGGTVLLFWAMSPTMIILFSVVNSFCSLFIIYTANTYSFDVMAQNETMRHYVAELNGFREAALSAGRILGLCIVMLFPATITGYIQAMCVLTLTQYVGVFMMKLVRDTLDRKQIRMSAQY